MKNQNFAAVAFSLFALVIMVLSAVPAALAYDYSDIDSPPDYSAPDAGPQASEGGAEGPSGPVDDVPSATASAPASAVPGSQIQVTVSGTDDRGVSQLLLFDSNDLLTDVADCLGSPLICSQAFTKAVPSASGASYVFRARAKDSAGQFSNVALTSGLTTTAVTVSPLPIITPAITTPVTTEIIRPSAAPSGPVRALQGVAVKFPLQQLFMRALSFVDSDCMRPGESALLAVNIRNVGRKTLDNVKFSATVPELGIRSAIGPFRLTSSDKSTRFLGIDIPADAADGQYFLRFVASDSVSNRIVHRIFTVDSSC